MKTTFLRLIDRATGNMEDISIHEKEKFEEEIQRAAKACGMSLEEALDRLKNGEILTTCGFYRLFKKMKPTIKG